MLLVRGVGDGRVDPRLDREALLGLALASQVACASSAGRHEPCGSIGASVDSRLDAALVRRRPCHPMHDPEIRKGGALMSNWLELAAAVLTVVKIISEWDD